MNNKYEEETKGLVLENSFFDRSPLAVAKALLGKVIRMKDKGIWLSAMIIETEAYEVTEKASHASLGFTQKRAALFMPAGTIYMYYARGGDSINVSCQGEGNGVLLKSAIPYKGAFEYDLMVERMQALNPLGRIGKVRDPMRLCSGQTLLCKSLNLKVIEWDKKSFCPERLMIEDRGYQPTKIIQSTRLGIPKGRDEHLLYRFIDYHYASYCTSNPLTKRVAPDYRVLDL